MNDEELAELRRDVLAAFDEVGALAGAEVAEARREMLATARERLAAAKYHVVVCGEFRRGKSSLLNALIERPGLFPVDVDVTTSAVMTLEWGPAEEAQVFFGDADADGHPRCSAIAAADAAAYVTEQANPGNAKNVARIALAGPLPQLRSGLVLVDTPGVGSVNVAHTAATRAFLPAADAILFVSSAVEPLSTIELEFLALALERSPIVVTAVTMIDKVVDPAAAVAVARSRIAQVSGTDPGQLTVIPVSSFRKREALDDEDDELLAESGFPDLERVLWNGLAASCGAAQLAEGIRALQAAVVDLSAPVANERTALRDAGAFAAIDQELKAAKTRAASFRSAGSRWRGDLQDDLEKAARPLREQMVADLEQVRVHLTQHQKTGRAVRDPNGVLKDLADELVDSAERASAALAEAAADVAATYSDLTSTKVAVDRISSQHLPIELAPVELVSSERHKGYQYTKFRQQMNGYKLSAGLGAVAGVLVLSNPVGLLLGGIAGAYYGWTRVGGQIEAEATARENRERLADFREQALPLVQSLQSRVREGFTEQQRDYVRALTRSLDEQIGSELESLTRSVERLGETRQKTAAERQARLRVLEESERRYAAVREQLSALQVRTGQLGRSSERKALPA